MEIALANVAASCQRRASVIRFFFVMNPHHTGRKRRHQGDGMRCSENGPAEDRIIRNVLLLRSRRLFWSDQSSGESRAIALSAYRLRTGREAHWAGFTGEELA